MNIFTRSLRPLTGALSLGLVGHGMVACEQARGALSWAAKRNSSSTPGPLQGTYDVCVVGGGIVGLATAREIIGRYPHMSVTVLEKEPEVAHHQTGHNSGVIHAGMYYEPGSTMARLCVQGADMIYEFCGEENIPVARVGKLICAPTAEDHHHVTMLKERGDLNGVKDLEVLSGSEVEKLEPNVKVHSALYSPHTGVVDYGVVSRRMAEIVSAHPGSSVQVQFQVNGFELKKDDDGVSFVEVTGVEPGQKGPVKTVHARNVITCAGLQADQVAQKAGGERKPAVLTFRGTYYQMKPEFRDICKMNIYPTPSGGGIPVGVHFTPTLNERRGHQTIVGPGACLTFHDEGYDFFDVSFSHMWKLATHIGLWRFVMGNWRFALQEMRRDLDKEAFMNEARKLIPSVTNDMVEESFAGVMCQLFQDDGKPNQADFVFERKTLDGTTLHVRSAPSPACTASMAIAEDVVALAAKDFDWGDGREKRARWSPYWKE